MNSKERVIRAINHKPTDRVPYDHLGGSEEINKKLYRHFNLRNTELLDNFEVHQQFNYQNNEELLQHFGVDIRRVNAWWDKGAYIGPAPVQTDKDSTEDARGCVYKAAVDSTGQRVSTLMKSPLSEAVTVDEVLNYKRFPSLDWYNYTMPERYSKYARDYALVLHNASVLFLTAMDFRGMENIMMDMAAEPDMANALFGKITDFNVERTRRYLEANPGLFDIIGIGDDIAGQDGLFFSIDMWRKYIEPHVKRMVDLCNEYKVIPFFHGCGGFSELYTDMIEMGVNVVGRLQTTAKGNNLERLKKDFGDRICLWGGIDAQHIVVEGTVEEVREHVKEVLRIGKNNSGFVASATHTFTLPQQNSWVNSGSGRLPRL